MGFLDKLTAKVVDTQSGLTAGLLAAQGKLHSSLTGLHSGAATAAELGFDPRHKPELAQVLAGEMADLSPAVRDARLAQLTKHRETKYPNLAWCNRCTRVYAGDRPSGSAVSGIERLFGSDDYRCIDFSFPSHAGYCVDCACIMGATIPCLITGQPFVPTPDPTVRGFGHSLVVPALAEVLKNGGIINADRSVRALTPLEIEGRQAVALAKKLFKECPVDVKPRLFFVKTAQPHWVIGHYVRIRASVVGLESAVSGYDERGVYYACVDEEVFQIKALEGRFEVDMAVDPERFSPERSSALGGAAAGAVTGGLHRASWGVHKWGGGGSIASGAALGAFQGLMAAHEESKRADAARDSAIQQHVNMTMETLNKIVSANLLTEQPPILAEAAAHAQGHQLSSWPNGVNVGAAAERLAKHPYSG